jgi:hypothetical protein
MAVKRIGIVLPMLSISGGINIILNWAVVLARAGYHLDIILPRSVGKPKVPFLSEADAGLLHLITEPEARQHRYHTIIATWWAGLAFLAELKAEHHAWFMQAYEGQFLELNSPAQADFDELVGSQINVITTAHWLQQHIVRHYQLEPKATFCVLSGLDKTLWKPVSRFALRPGGRPVRFLVEGPTTDPRKNTARTVRLLEELGVEYRWVGAIVDRSLTGPKCKSVDENVPYHRMPRIYGWADVLVKASNAEGMFGPPLEMFATGGTAAVWHVQGAEEYMAHRHNGLLVPMNSWRGLAEAVTTLAEDAALVRTLREHALATAEAWPTWADQAEQIVTTIESLSSFGRCSLVRQLAKNQFRSIIHSQPVIQEAHRAAAEGRRAAEAEAELARMTTSRAWRLVRLMKRVRVRLAPDGSRRWSYVLGTGRVIWRAGRRLKRRPQAA